VTATAPDTTAPVRGRFLGNVVANLANFALQIVIGIWFTPYLIRHIGTAAYGLVPLAYQVTDYMKIATMALNSAVGRYLTIALSGGDERQANRVFNTSLGGTFTMGVVLMPFAFIFAFHADKFIHVPPDLVTDARWLFVCTSVMFFMTTFASPFEVVSYCRNRFDLRNGVLMASQVLRVAIVIAMFMFFPARLSYVGLGLLGAGTITLVGALAIWRALGPELRVAPRMFDRSMLRELTAMGGWSVVNQVGTILFLYIDLLVVNLLLGAETAGRYATALQWSMMLRGLAGAIAGVFGPTILSFYARNEMKDLIEYSRRSVRLVGVTMALPIGLVCGLSRPLLSRWLGPEFVSQALLMSLLTGHLCINLAYLPLQTLPTAANRVRWPGIASLAMGGANLALALILAGPVHWGPYGVAAAGAIVLSAKNILFTPIYGAHVIGQPKTTFLRELVPIPIVTAIIAGGAWLLSSALDLATWPRLFVAGCAFGIFYLPLAWFVVLRRKDRELVRERLTAVAARFRRA
jgi:membrane protein EpsK